MIVCHKHRFIFVKTRKTAGTSIEVALSSLCGEGDIITPIAPEDERVRQELRYRGPQNDLIPFRRYRGWEWRRLLLRGKRARFFNHMTARRARIALGDEIWNSYFKFCFDRNPWDRIVSLYHWRCFRAGDTGLNFDKFLLGERPYLMSNYDIYSIDGQVAVDFVGRYENLVEDFNRALTRIGIDTKVDLPRLKATARTDRRPYQQIITPDQQRYIANYCGSEIALLGYEFSAPQRP